MTARPSRPHRHRSRRLLGAIGLLAAALLATPTAVGSALALQPTSVPHAVVHTAPSGSTAVDPRTSVSAVISRAPALSPAEEPFARTLRIGTSVEVSPAPHPDDTGIRESVHYEEALAHAGDRITFTPGDRVTVPFRPRPTDDWTVGGVAPRQLPAGLVTGRQMATARQGSAWTLRAPAGWKAPTGAAQPEPPIDAPAPAPGTVVQAEPASARLAGSGPLAPAALTVLIPADPLSTQAGLRRQVFGFLPYWELSDSSTTLDYGLLSTIAYFSVGVDRSGNLLKRNADGSTTTGWSGWTSSKLTSIIDAAHARGARVVLTITMFAWTSTQASTQAAFLADPTARQNLARQAAAAVRDRGADGINLDFEPIAAGYADEFAALVRSMRTELDAIAPGYQLTFDTTGRIGNYPLEDATAPGAADAVFVMGYDYRTAGTTYAGSISPLAGPPYDLTDTVLAYLGRVPASKLILGVPYYGRAWSTVSDALNAKNQSGTKYGASATVVYGKADALAAQYGRRYDTVEQSAWFAYQRQNCTATYGCVTTWRSVYYDDAQSLRAKYDLINRYGLRGAGIWALGYDGTRPELYQALADKFVNDTTAPAAGIVTLSETQRDEGFLVDWTARDDYNAVTSYDVQVSVDGGPWTSWLANTTAGAEIYLGRDGHGYAFRVRARDSKNNLGAWDVASVYVASPSLAVGGFGRVQVDGLSMRAGPDPNATRIGTLSAGTILALSAGPVEAGGSSWYQVISPITEWGTVRQTQVGSWVAATSGGVPYVTPVRAPNSTLVSAGIGGLSFGDAGPASVGAAPTASVHRAFSPNGDDSQDTLQLRWTNRIYLDSLTLHLYRPDGSLLESRPIGAGAAGAQAYDWDGRVGGAPVADGTYLLQLVGSSGGVTYSAPSAKPVTAAQLAAYAVTVDTVAPTLGAATIKGSPFSPDADGVRDQVSVSGSAVDATRWIFTAAPVVDDGAAAPVRTISGSGSSSALAWDGRTDAGAVAPDGQYRLTLRLLDAAGNGPMPGWTVTLDVRDPAVALTPTVLTFSPNGDGADDRVSLAWTADELAGGWVRVLRGTTLIRRWSQPRGTGATIVWDGRDASGRLVADGRYTIEADLTDPAGNRTLKRAVVTVDRTSAVLRWSPGAFAPDGDTLLATSRVSFRLIRTASTTLQVFDAGGRLVRTAWSGRTRYAGTYSWTWDGRNGHKELVPGGRYVAVLTSRSSIGTSVLRRTVIADAFIVAPSATTLKAGDTLTVTITSVEPLKALPTVTLTQTGVAAVSTTVEAIATNRYRATFTIAAGAGPATVTVTGTDTAGKTNSSMAAVTVE